MQPNADKATHQPPAPPAPEVPPASAPPDAPPVPTFTPADAATTGTGGAPEPDTEQRGLEKDVRAALSALKESLEKSPPQERLKKFIEVLGSVRTIVSTLLLTGLTILLVGMMYVELRKSAVQITSFEVPPDLVKAGYTPQVIASQLADRIAVIRKKAKARDKRLQVNPSSYDKLPDIEVPEAKVSLTSLIQYTKELLGFTPTRVGGEIISDEKGLYLTVRIIKNSEKGEVANQTFGGPTETLDGALAKAAQYVVRENDPYLLAAYLYETDKREEALELTQFCIYNKKKDDTWAARVFNSSKDDTWALYLLWGLILAEKGESEEAIAKFKQVLEINPKSALAYTDWGLALEGQKDYEGAVAMYKKAIDIDPTAAMAYNDLGNILIMRGKYDEAVSNFQKAIELEPTLTLPYRNWAAALLSKGAYKEANAVYQRAAATNPNAAIIYKVWGWALLQQKDLAAAANKYRRATEIEPLYSEAYSDWGHVLHQQGKYPEAESKYQMAIEADPNNAQAYHNWGVTLQSVGDYRGAIPKLQKAVEISQQNAAAYIDLGYSFEMLNEYDKAVASYEKAIELDPRSALAHFNLAYLLEKQRRYGLAVSNFRKVLEFQQDGELYDYAKSAVPKLEQRLSRATKATRT